MMKLPYLLGLGGAHLDRRGRTLAPHRAGASNPGRLIEEVGGGAFNATRAAVRRGVRAGLFSLRGGDYAGQMVASAMAEAGIDDLSATFLDRTTPSYTAILDADGELVTGLADMELYERAFEKQIRRRPMRDAIKDADAVLCDANMPAPALALLAEAAAEKPLYAIAVSQAKVVRLMPLLERLDGLFLNFREARILAQSEAASDLAGVARTLMQNGLRAGVITAGSGQVAIIAGKQLATLAPPPVAAVADVTGAGDALAGATVAALMRGLPMLEAAREGIAAAGLAIAQFSAASHFDEKSFRKALARVPFPETQPA